MKTRITIFIVAVVAIVGVLIGYNVYNQRQKRSTNQNDQSAATSGNKKTQSSSSKGKVAKKNGKTLIVYFSRKDGVYGGNLKVGNTKRIADFIQAKTKGDEYEIVPAKEYPKSYKKTTEVAQKEQEDNARPKIKNKLPDVSKYDTIFIGSPIWWSEYPMVVRTFLDGVNLNNKNVVPFTTHEGSGLGNTTETLKKQYTRAKVLKGFSVSGSDAADARSDVNSWLNGLGY